MCSGNITEIAPKLIYSAKSTFIRPNTRTGYDLFGKRFSVTTWVKGKENGPSVDYYEKNKIYIKAYYRDGLADGTWLFYDTNGNLYQKIIYKKGKLIRETSIKPK